MGMEMKKSPKKRMGLLSLVLAALGITSGCDILGFGMCMYGSPTADFEAEGRVTDEFDKPIEGIQVVISEKYNNTENVIYDYNLMPVDTLFTDVDGRYSLETMNSGFTNQIQFDFEDVDGKENGGDFDRASVVMDVEYKGGDKSWYIGKADVKVPTVRLKRK